MSSYAVVGNPISHSKSPLIHALFAKQSEQAISYTAILVSASAFDAFIPEFFAEGGKGLNVTVPYKGRAFELASSCSPRANLAKAVNTLYLDKEGNICGDNTDGIGLITDIKVNHGFEIRDRRVLILGAGGAVRGALAALINEQAASITVVNRTLPRAKLLVNQFIDVARLQALSYPALDESARDGCSYNLIINATSLGLHGEMPAINSSLIADDCCCYDMMYADADTVFVQWAKQQGAKLSTDGLGMLVEQAAEAFALWRGIRPDTASVIAALRNES